MKRIVALAALCACVVPVACFAQATASEGKFAYCKVTDNGGHKIWVSQVFPVPAQTGLLDTALATEFHTYVAGLGGAGDKDCLVTLTREAAQETRSRIEAIMRKRVFGISVFKWHDVAWTPSAAALAAAAAPASAAAADSFIYCRGVDTDARKLVTSGVFVRPLPPVTSGLRFQELERHAREFGDRVRATHSIDPQPLCIASDSRAEADKSREDYRKSFAFTGVGKIDVAWEPTPAAPALRATAPPTPEPARAAAAPGVADVPVDDVEAEFWRRIAAAGRPPTSTNTSPPTRRDAMRPSPGWKPDGCVRPAMPDAKQAWPTPPRPARPSRHLARRPPIRNFRFRTM